MATLIVDDNNNGDFSTVAEAVAAAEAGDTIDITGGFDGVHNETDILVNKDLTITSSSNATIDAEGKGRIFTIDDGNADNQLDVTVKNMVLTGGNADDETVEETDANFGGVIFNKESLTIEQIRATDNYAVARGGAIYNTDGDIEVIRSVFTKNSNGIIESDDIGVGGAIYSENGSIDIKESTFTENTAELFGGAIASLDGALTMERSIVSNNFARNLGGGIFHSGGSATLTEVSINDNETFFGGGIHNQGESEMTVVRSNISNNLAVGLGAGLTNVGGAQFTARETSIQGNKVVSEIPGRDFGDFNPSTLIGRGAGIAQNFEASTTLINSSVNNNQAELAAGISTEGGGPIEIQNSQVTDNTAVLTETFDFLNPNIIEFPNAIFDPSVESANLMGTPENDIVVGENGNDTLDGGAGVNLLRGNFNRNTDSMTEDSNTFVLSTEAEATLIDDFIDGQDVIGLKGEISFNDLSFSDSIISLNDKPIAFLNDVDTTLLTSEDFVEV